MKINKGDLVANKVIAEVAPAQRCFNQLLRPARFEDGTYGILRIKGGEVTTTDFNDLKLRRALKESTRLPTINVICGGEKITIHGRDTRGEFRLDFNCQPSKLQRL